MVANGSSRRGLISSSSVSSATKRYDPDQADFDVRYGRWLAALESGYEAELAEATAALPALNKRVLTRLELIDQDVDDPVTRATQKRLIVLLSEIRAHEVIRLRQLLKARQRRLDRSATIERAVELPSSCARCGTTLREVKPTGRTRIY